MVQKSRNHVAYQFTEFSKIYQMASCKWSLSLVYLGSVLKWYQCNIIDIDWLGLVGALVRLKSCSTYMTVMRGAAGLSRARTSHTTGGSSKCWSHFLLNALILGALTTSSGRKNSVGFFWSTSFSVSCCDLLFYQICQPKTDLCCLMIVFRAIFTEDSLFVYI